MANIKLTCIHFKIFKMKEVHLISTTVSHIFFIIFINLSIQYKSRRFLSIVVKKKNNLQSFDLGGRSLRLTIQYYLSIRSKFKFCFICTDFCQFSYKNVYCLLILSVKVHVHATK